MAKINSLSYFLVHRCITSFTRIFKGHKKLFPSLTKTSNLILIKNGIVFFNKKYACTYIVNININKYTNGLTMILPFITPTISF